ncbi:hypothetical protein [Kibdelosporangium phytohabitans]|uniref:hypothetical protein n=1 Tax=Kibdelosporangium phytohabitans TaxID=860235 RepID=UPI000A48BF69|nr:hypothetical protein [Kibdelosporangium phytohabitans]MBE1467639.1 hypothetical protein [Kibdelosporangium phytohabitans]
MINPGEIPQIPGDMDALSSHAGTLKSTGTAFANTGAQVHSKWQSLAAVYEAPEVGELLNATRPVSEISDEVGGNMETVGNALNAYAATVKPIKAKLDSLRTQAQAFVADAKGDEDWREDEDKVNKHNGLLTQVNEAVAEWMQAQRTCANAINAIYGGIQYVGDNGDEHRDKNEFGYTKDQLNSALASENGLPWGKPEEHDGGFWGDVGDFFVGIKDGFVQMITDLGALIGYADGKWSWETAGAAWKGLGTFALALGVYALPGGLGAALDQKVGIPGFGKGELGNTLLNAGKGIIAYDQWGKGHNGRAAGQATFNIVSAVVGTKGAGGALRGAGAALKGAEAGAVAARVGGAFVRAGDFVVKMPTVGELGIKIANKLNIQIPHLGPLPAFAGDGPPIRHHFDVEMPNTRGPDVAHMDSHRPDLNGPSVNDAFHHPDADPTPSHPDTGNGDPQSSPDTGGRDEGTSSSGGTDGPPSPHPESPQTGPSRELSTAERAANDTHLQSLEARHPNDFDHLQRDPDKSGNISEPSKDEARVGLALREDGRLPSDIQRPPTRGKGEFYSPSTGEYYDIKGVHSDWPPFNNQRDKSYPFPGAYDPANNAKFVDKLEGQIEDLGRTVIIDTRNANQAAIDNVRAIVEQKGWGDSVIWYP